jgi:MoaA/NifB/PqqE/SkfB family radical SAM enzyme
MVADMNLNDIKKLISEAVSLGAKTLELGGGEPMMRKDIYDIITYASALGLYVFMATNGVLIGQAEAKKLMDAGLDFVTFSLEGPEQLNDSIRGNGNFQKTINAIKYFRSFRQQMPEFKVGAGITLSKYNYKCILEFSRFLLEEAEVDTISINPVNMDFLSYENRILRANEFNIPPELIEDLAYEIEQLIKYGETVPGRLPKRGYLSKFPEYFKGKKIVPQGGCGIPASFLGISADGKVFSCWHASQVGDLKETGLIEIFRSDAWKKAFDNAQNGKCNGCLASCYFDLY